VPKLIAAILSWGEQRSFQRPAAAYARIEGSAVDSLYGGPIRHTMGLAIERKKSVSRSVSNLLIFCGPHAITGAIAFVSFEPLDTVFGARSRAHIGNKLLKRTFPSVANGDTSAAVVLELGVSWIPASLTDGEPNPILRHLGHAVRYTTYGSAGLPATEKAAKFVFSGWSTKALLTTFKAMVLYFRHLRTSFLGATGWSRFLDSAPLTHYNLEQLKGFNYA
jgi:hypothetical protein